MTELTVPFSPLPASAALVDEPAGAEPAGLPALTLAEVASARGYIDASRAASTRKAYGADWTRFSLWCRGRDAPALPAAPALVAVYLSALAARGQAPPSIARALAAIAHHHRRAGSIPPHRAEGGLVTADILAGIRRSRVLGPERKAATDADVVMQLLGSIAGDSLAVLRDCALIAFGMALAARRSELSAQHLKL